MLTETLAQYSIADFGAEVRFGLAQRGQKELPSKYLYDDVGSRLFDVIAALPEYGLTRAEERILRRHAPELAAHLDRPLIVAELGSGNGAKTRRILEALGGAPSAYYPIEISPSALAMCARELGDMESISIVGLERDYLDGLAEAASYRRPGERLLVLFLGSTIGNFESSAAIQFLRQMREILQFGDALLLGTDMEKAVPVILDAYDDALGVTAAFNLNLLARINRELTGDFSLNRFEHVALFNEQTRSIEMHIRSKCAQEATIAKAGLIVRFEPDETIWTESSHKYSMDEIVGFAADSGFRCDATWTDPEWAFADSLWTAC